MLIIGTNFYQIKVITMIKNYHQLVQISHNPNWPYIPNCVYRILIIGGSRSGKIMELNKNQQPDIDKIYFYIKDPFELKYQLLINGKDNVGIKKLKNQKAFIDYSQTIADVYENLEDYNPTKKRRLLLVFDDIIADMKANKKLSPIITELFLRGGKRNISLVFISQYYFKVPKTMR